MEEVMSNSIIHPITYARGRKTKVKPGFKVIGASSLKLEPSPFPSGCKCGHKINIREYSPPYSKRKETSACKVPPINKYLKNSL